ncbi:unnamed protein product [Cladocopium goreaui]|uniref:Uncharacterized protein n=1 Tax=Cladocopium goreaui TaxID=2562237 RepID=A0A9P1DIF5_9DINO|nr:unnamed protein product [Cladocopium goreaui]
MRGGQGPNRQKGDISITFVQNVWAQGNADHNGSQYKLCDDLDVADHQDAHREVLDKAWCGLFAAARRLRVRACGPWTVYPRLQCTKVEANCRRTGICEVCEVAQDIRTNPEKRKGCVACIRQTSVRNWYKSLKGKAKLQTGLCMCMLLSLHLRKSQSKTPLWDALGWNERERERVRFATSCRVTFIRTSNFHCFEVLLPCPFQVKLWLATE